jgi:hypothetical protein
MWGKISLGKGSTPSDGTAELDLSKTDVVQYSGIADIMGGLKFRDSNDDLTSIKVEDAFFNLDGLSRKNRVRYDVGKSPGKDLWAMHPGFRCFLPAQDS